MAALIEQLVAQKEAEGRVVVTDEGPCFYGTQFPSEYRNRIPVFCAVFDSGGMKVSVTNKWEPVNPNIEVFTKETKKEIWLPYDIFFAALFPYGKSADVLAGLTESIKVPGAFVYSSSPRTLLEKVNNDECRDWQREVGSEGLRNWMRFSLTIRLREGNIHKDTKETAEFVLSTLETGPNIDIKMPVEAFGPQIHDRVVEYFQSLHGESMTVVQSGEDEMKKTVTTYFLSPHDESWNEPGFRFPARGWHEKYNSYDVDVQLVGAKPVVKVTYAPIPNNTKNMRFIKVEFGYFLPSDVSVLPEPAAVNMRLHITHTTDEGADLRDNAHNTSWQTGVKGMIEEGYIVLKKHAVRAWQQPIEFKTSMFDDLSFGIMEMFRGIRGHLARFDTTQHEMLASIEGKTLSEAVGDDVPGGYFLEKNRALIEKGVAKLLLQSPLIHDQLRKEIMSDIATSCLVSPLGFIEIIRSSKAHRLFKGLKEFDDQDLDQISHTLYSVLGKTYGFGDSVHEPYLDDSSEPSERWWVDHYYKTYSISPKFDNYKNNHSKESISWSSDPDGISEVVRAVEMARIQKGLPVLSEEVSLISRFCEYMQFVF